MPEKSYKKKHMTSFQLIILGFAGVILLGTVLLMLPFSSAEKVITPFHEALFTATSAVCVTGLVVKDTGSYWSLAGQTIILALIQIGGLGVVTVAASVSILFMIILIRFPPQLPIYLSRIKYQIKSRKARAGPSPRPFPLKPAFNQNDKSERITHTDHAARIIITWSE